MILEPIIYGAICYTQLQKNVYTSRFLMMNKVSAFTHWFVFEINLGGDQGSFLLSTRKMIKCILSFGVECNCPVSFVWRVCISWYVTKYICITFKFHYEWCRTCRECKHGICSCSQILVIFMFKLQIVHISITQRGMQVNTSQDIPLICMALLRKWCHKLDQIVASSRKNC